MAFIHSDMQINHMDAPMSKRPFFLTFVLVFTLVTALAASGVAAQDSTGQFWVQAFEDRNGDGVHNAGEPFLTSGVTVDLLNADGVVMASGSLDNAPYAAQGFLGFLYLAPGTYTAVISSPDLTPTTSERVDVTISEEQDLVRVSYGAQEPTLTETTTAATPFGSVRGQVARVALAGFGALVVVGIMVMIGVLVYALVLRKRAPVEMKRTTTGSMRPVRVTDTGAFQTSELRQTGDARQTGEQRRTNEVRQAADKRRTDEVESDPDDQWKPR